MDLPKLTTDVDIPEGSLMDGWVAVWIYTLPDGSSEFTIDYDGEHIGAATAIGHLEVAKHRIVHQRTQFEDD